MFISNQTKKTVKTQELLEDSIGLSIPKILTKTCKFIIKNILIAHVNNIFIHSGGEMNSLGERFARGGLEGRGKMCLTGQKQFTEKRKIGSVEF